MFSLIYLIDFFVSIQGIIELGNSIYVRVYRYKSISQLKTHGPQAMGMNLSGNFDYES